MGIYFTITLNLTMRCAFYVCMVTTGEWKQHGASKNILSNIVCVLIALPNWNKTLLYSSETANNKIYILLP